MLGSCLASSLGSTQLARRASRAAAPLGGEWLLAHTAFLSTGQCSTAVFPTVIPRTLAHELCPLRPPVSLWWNAGLPLHHSFRVPVSHGGLWLSPVGVLQDALGSSQFLLQDRSNCPWEQAGGPEGHCPVLWVWHRLRAPQCVWHPVPGHWREPEDQAYRVR